MLANAHFSDHLFWDCDDVDLDKNEVWLCQRVLEYGVLTDWEMLVKLYGKARIREAVLKMRTLKDKPRAFVCCVLNIEENSLRCYKNKQFQIASWQY